MGVTIRKSILLAGFCLLLAVLVFISISKGSVNQPLSLVIQALTDFEQENKYHLMIVNLRLPRILASALVGSGFGVAGALMQGSTQNPMADSGLLGINAGSSFFLALCFAFLPQLSYMELLLFSFLGAALGGICVQVIAYGGQQNVSKLRLILAGVAVSAMFTAFSQAIARIFKVDQNLMFWTAGGVGGVTWSQLKIFSLFIFLGLLAAIILSPAVSMLSLGDEVAQGLGVNVLFVQYSVNLVVICLAGVSVAVVGPISFVGLVVPYGARFCFGSNYRWIIPGSIVIGAILLVLADFLARNLIAPSELPMGILIALIGVPFFLVIAKNLGGK
ncbi:iron chelate uptake ABC transporter family permease subunit [Erwinia sp. CPCC 100877]|nr:iron chelate uptake ABC transporter family permease subunit [Erwinia sp. CPCC 100877]